MSANNLVHRENNCQKNNFVNIVLIRKRKSKKTKVQIKKPRQIQDKVQKSKSKTNLR